jgi:asparaginyl-tRNA synthetase
VIDEKLADYEELTKMTMGYCIEAHGNVVKSGGAGQSFEMQATAVKILGTVPEDYPLQKKATSLEFLREVAHLRPRTNTFNAVFRLRHILAMATHQFFSERGFYYINTPLITGSDAEGAGELFRVSTLHAENPPKNKDGKVDFSKDYFGRETFLAVTGQLEAEAYALALGSVYTFGPTFRSEKFKYRKTLV